MTMPTNKPACTVWERTVADRAPVWIRHELGACYWEDTRSQRTGKDRAPDDSVFLCIPASSLSDYVPRTDDRLAPGAVPEAAPPHEALTVTRVKDFRYGQAMMQHIEVTAV